jgi:hypothetical protein
VLCVLVVLALISTPSWSIQCAVPTSDEDNATYWWDTPGSGSAHYTSIDEDTACAYNSTAGDEIQEDDGSVYRAVMGSLTDPVSSTGHTWTVRARISSNKAHTLTADLYDGGSKINTSTSCTTSALTGTLANLQCTLSASEADAISTGGYASLEIYLTATSTNPTDVFVESVNIEVPSVAGGDELMVIAP